MNNKILIGIVAVVGLLLISTAVLTKMGVVEAGDTYESSQKDIEPTLSVDNLEDDSIYVWKAGQDKDISDKDNLFLLCPSGNTNIEYDKRSSGGANYTVWIDSAEDYKIPTLTNKDKLLFVSKDYIPDNFNFLRLYENGYSVGVTSFTPDDSGHFYILYRQNSDDDYKDFINLKADAADLSGLSANKLYLDKVGGAVVTEKRVSPGGVVTGLKRNKSYVCEFYTGTYYQDFLLKANQHTFTEFEDFTCNGYSFLHSNCISIDIPKWLKSGFYYINGIGLFRYVADEDVSKYSGKAYDKNIDWNEPIILYDEQGFVKYDPSREGLSQLPEEQEEDTTETGELPEEATGDTATWKYTISGEKDFGAVVNVSKISNGFNAQLSVTAPDGTITEFEEKDNKFTVKFDTAIDGDYIFNLSNISGRNFAVLYSNGDSYFGDGEDTPQSEDKEE